jgi:hypothetical protein
LCFVRGDPFVGRLFQTGACEKHSLRVGKLRRRTVGPAGLKPAGGAAIRGCVTDGYRPPTRRASQRLRRQ